MRGGKKRTFSLSDPEKWEEFRERYLKDLKQGTAVCDLLDAVTGESLTLVYAARDAAHNHALVLQEYLKTLISK
ncbi:MAG: DUF488 family protein [Geobacteraceae bacterium]|nr:DUF488 family protein [Geobacteraceae bacterium]